VLLCRGLGPGGRAYAICHQVVAIARLNCSTRCLRPWTLTGSRCEPRATSSSMASACIAKCIRPTRKTWMSKWRMRGLIK